ncbi:MAG: histidinol-phosphatase HisJ family protein [Ruminococcaceae bacterium]|nr:histidinol-phosphatase HisJ family protein [Oscillospiraceae bacterium]
MNYSNLHTHSIYSDGKHSPREIIEQAIAQNMTAIGISDHSYTFFDEAYCISKENNQKYIDELRALKAEYSSQIDVLVGIELDGLSNDYNKKDFDYVIGSCHYINFDGDYRSVDSSLKGVVEAINTLCGGDSLYFAKRYFETYSARIEAMRPDILGHIDLVAKLGVIDEELPEYRKMAIQTLVDSLSHTNIIEMNTGAISRGYRKIPYPAPFLLKEIKERGAKIILSSDSHSKDTLTFFFDECLEILRNNGINSIITYKNGTFEEVGI